MPRRRSSETTPNTSRDESATANTSARRKQAKPKHRKQHQTPAIREIRRLQNTTSLLISKGPFYRLIREIMERYMGHGGMYRIQLAALEALQESTEMYITLLMEDAYRCTLHRERVTLTPKDMQLARMLRGPADPGNWT